MNKAERAHKALLEAADAVEDLPAGVRTFNIFGLPMVNAQTLRDEAKAIMRRVNTAAEAMEESRPKDDDYDDSDIPIS